MGVDWWIEKLAKIEDDDRVSFQRHDMDFIEKMGDAFEKITGVSPEDIKNLDDNLSNLATRMSRYPEKELLFLGAITGCDICPAELIGRDEFNNGVTPQYYENIKKVIDCIESLYLTDLYERIKNFNVEGAYFESFEAFVTFFHKLLKTIYELYKKGEYYAIFEG